MSASKLIHCFFSHPAILGFGILCHLIISLWILPIRWLISLSDFQTGIGAATYPILDTEQANFHTRTTLVDTIASLRCSVGGLIASSVVHELPAKIHDILHSVMVKMGLAIWLIFSLIFLILLPGSIIKSWLPSPPFFTLWRIPFLLVRHVCIVASAYNWQRLTNKLHLDCHSLQPLWRCQS